MTDICERLRADAIGHAPRRKATLLEAADEIDLLRAQVAEGRDQLIVASEILKRVPKVCRNIYLGADRNSYSTNCKEHALRIDAYLAKTK